MKWKMQRYNNKANTHRAGWAFWDLITQDNEVLAFIRYRPTIGYDVTPSDRALEYDFENRVFAIEQEAKDYAVAYFVNKRLEEAND